MAALQRIIIICLIAIYALLSVGATSTLPVPVRHHPLFFLVSSQLFPPALAPTKTILPLASYRHY